MREEKIPVNFRPKKEGRKNRRPISYWGKRSFEGLLPAEGLRKRRWKKRAVLSARGEGKGATYELEPIVHRKEKKKESTKSSVVC